MKINQIYTVVVLAFGISIAPTLAQQELMLHSMPDVWHANSTNPAFFPEHKTILVGLPGIGLDAEHSGDVSYRDIFVKNGDQTVLDFGNIINKLQPVNEVRFEQRNETFSIGLKLPLKIMLSAGHATRVNGSILYPKTLPELLWNGNGPYIGQTLNIGLSANVSSFNEWSIGLAKKFGKVTVGVRGKLLTGISSLVTDPDHQTATVYTSPDIYQLTLNTDYGFHSSQIISAFDTSGLGFDLQLGGLKGDLFTKNTGAAFDFGVQVKLNDKWSFDAAVLDLGGSIKWDTRSNYYLSQGSYEYEGQVFPGSDIINGADSLDFETKLDSLNDIFNFQKTPASYNSELPVRVYAGVGYQLSKRISIGLSAYFSQRENAEDTYAVGANVRLQVLRWLSVGAMYSVNQRNAANIGFHVASKTGPVQLYFTSDNLLNAFTPKKSSVVNLRAGAALVF
ncbi:MAG: hypothetical protein JNJ57_11040 [Saprospiraceae bacterium]|nr:hypothetical protein [Saprospiraceae bacterium]